MKFQSEMTWKIVLVIVVAMFVSGGLYMWHRNDKPLSRELSSAKQRFETAKVMVEEYQKLPDLGDLGQEWIKFKALAKSCGLSVVTDGAQMNDAKGKPLQFANSASNWQAVVGGEVTKTVACMDFASKTMNVQIVGAKISNLEGVKKLDLLVAVLGQH